MPCLSLSSPQVIHHTLELLACAFGKDKATASVISIRAARFRVPPLDAPVAKAERSVVTDASVNGDGNGDRRPLDQPGDTLDDTARFPAEGKLEVHVDSSPPMMRSKSASFTLQEAGCNSGCRAPEGYGEGSCNCLCPGHTGKTRRRSSPQVFPLRASETTLSEFERMAIMSTASKLGCSTENLNKTQQDLLIAKVCHAWSVGPAAFLLRIGISICLLCRG